MCPSPFLGRERGGRLDWQLSTRKRRGRKRGRKGVKGELRRKWGRERAKNRGREGNTCAHARQLVVRGRLGRRPLLSRPARAVARSSRAPFSTSSALARRCRRLGGGGPGALASRSLVHPPGAPPLRACAAESAGSGCRLPDEGSCQPVGRSSRRPSPSLVVPAPRIPRWGRSGDGGSGIAEQERERLRGPIRRGGHGRPSPRPQPGRHRPVRPAGERAVPQLRPGSRPRRRGAGWPLASRAPRRPSPAARPVPLGDPRSLPGRPPGLGPRPLLFPLHLLQILGSHQFGPHPAGPRPHTSLPPLPLLRFRALCLRGVGWSPSSPSKLKLHHLQNLYYGAPP